MCQTMKRSTAIACAVAQFGLARMMHGCSGVVAVSKTTNPRWSAPEVIKSSQV
jgi:hypothetical protein